MVIPPEVGTPLEVIEAQLVLELQVVLLDPPAALGEADEAAEAERFPPEIGQPLLRGGRLVRGPLDEAGLLPEHRAAPGGPAVGAPDGEPGEAGGEGPLAPLAPGYSLPGTWRERLGQDRAQEGSGCPSVATGIQQLRSSSGD